jgi:hypothetical protein
MGDDQLRPLNAVKGDLLGMSSRHHLAAPKAVFEFPSP